MDSLREKRLRKVVSLGRDEEEGSTVFILECGHLHVTSDVGLADKRFIAFKHVYESMVFDCRECCA